MPRRHSRKKSAPKRGLTLSELEHSRTAVSTSLASASGQRT